MLKKLFYFLIVVISSQLLFGQDTQYYLSLDENGGTSANARAPQGGVRYSRTVYLITPTEMASSGLVNGDVVSAIGFVYSTAQNIATTGNFKVYLENTSETTNNKSTTWATAITGMTQTSNSTITIPATTGQVNHVFSGGSSFTYTGGGLYIAFEYENASGTLATTTNVAMCSTALTSGLKSALSSTAMPTTIAASNWRPMTYLGKTVPCGAIVGLTMSSYNQNSATISWTTSASVQLEWGMKPYSQGSGGSTASITAGTTYTINGLAEGKAYDVYVRKNCSGIYSSWSKVTVGTTSPTAITSYPYSANFDPAIDQNFLFNFGWGNQSTGNVGTWQWFSDDTTDNDTTNDFSQSSASFLGSALNTTAVDAWIFSKPLKMVGGATYTISYYYRTYSNATTTGPISFRVGINSSNSSTGATILATHANYNNLSYVQETLQFVPPTTGDYYLGFNNNTPANSTITTINYIFVDTVLVNGQSLGTNETLLKNTANLVYPNPTKDVLNIKSNSKIIAVEIYDISGKRMNAQLDNNQVDVRHLTPGTYMISIETKDGKTSEKFIKK